jgi:hypothetical protein
MRLAWRKLFEIQCSAVALKHGLSALPREHEASMNLEHGEHSSQCPKGEHAEPNDFLVVFGSKHGGDECM